MADVSVSLWLPVGRANFYSVTANAWTRVAASTGSAPTFASKKINDPDEPDYIPMLQCSVLRRLLEVLPLSFGYNVEGVCELASETDEQSRPVAVTMTLADVGASLQPVAGDHPGQLPSRERANTAVHHAGVGSVVMRADEYGNYTFTASVLDGYDLDEARQALVTHAREVFGGDFEVKRFEPQPRRGGREGAAAVRRYNGLTDEPGRTLAADVLGPPLGVLTFFQLNTLVEGICNETLWPAVFFERYAFMQEWRHEKETAVSILHTIGDIVDVIHVDDDASALSGQITTLRHFLAVTSRESLQRIKWSVESVRRSLLDEMMSVLHRQSRLIQLDLGAIKRERSPELAMDASESQLRGYVMLAAAKLPLIGNVYEVAKLTVDHIKTKAKATSLDDDAQELDTQLSHWKVLLEGLSNNVRSLENAVEQAWMERLLYEEAQSRSEQEAMAEIERSRLGRPTAGGAGRSVYDGLNLVVAVLSVLFVVFTTPLPAPSQPGDRSWWHELARLWPIAVVAVVFYLVIPGFRFLFRWLADRKGRNSNFSYEFAFLLDEPTEPFLASEYIHGSKRERIKRCAADIEAQLDAGHDKRMARDREKRLAAAQAEARQQAALMPPDDPATDTPAVVGPVDASAPTNAPATPNQTTRVLTRRPPLKGLSLVRLGGGRIERISADNSSLKLHSVATFKVAPFRYARFEVVQEILANRVSDQPRYLLHQIRMFGDSPKPIEHADIVELVDVIFSVVARPMASDDKVEDPLTLLRAIYD